MNAFVIIISSVLGTMIILRLIFKARLLQFIKLLIEINEIHLNPSKSFEEQFTQSFTPYKELIIALNELLTIFFWKKSSRESMLITFLKAVNIHKKFDGFIADYLGRTKSFQEVAFMSHELAMYEPILIARVIKSCISSQVQEQFTKMLTKKFNVASSN